MVLFMSMLSVGIEKHLNGGFEQPWVHFVTNHLNRDSVLNLLLDSLAVILNQTILWPPVWWVMSTD